MVTQGTTPEELERIAGERRKGALALQVVDRSYALMVMHPQEHRPYYIELYARRN